jgi:hypothetical protein
MRYQLVRVVRPGQFHFLTRSNVRVTTPCSRASGANIDSPMWGGVFSVEAAVRFEHSDRGQKVGQVNSHTTLQAPFTKRTVPRRGKLHRRRRWLTSRLKFPDRTAH